MKLPEDVTSEEIKDNLTWNTCPNCHLSWETKPPIPGLLHRTILCHNCQEKVVKSTHYYD